MLNYIKTSGKTVDETIDLLIQRFNTLRLEIPSLKFMDMHLLSTINSEQEYVCFGVIITDQNELETKKPRFIGMPENADPTNPNWNRTYIGS